LLTQVFTSKIWVNFFRKRFLRRSGFYEQESGFNHNIRNVRAGAVFGFCGKQFCQHPRVGKKSVQRAKDIYGDDYGAGIRGGFGVCSDIGGVSAVYSLIFIMLDVVVAKSEGVVFAGKVRSVILPGEQGVFEILSYHKPIISRLITGNIIIDGQVFPITRGIVGVNNNKATIIVEG